MQEKNLLCNIRVNPYGFEAKKLELFSLLKLTHSHNSDNTDKF